MSAPRRYGQRHELFLYGPIEPRERLRRGIGQRREPRETLCELLLAGRETFREAALVRFLVNFPLQPIELTGREQMRAAIVGAPQRVGRGGIDGRKIEAIDAVRIILGNDSRAHLDEFLAPARERDLAFLGQTLGDGEDFFLRLLDVAQAHGALGAMSSRRISAARLDMFLKTFCRIVSSAPLSAVDSMSLDLAQNRLHAAIVELEQNLEDEQQVFDLLAEIRTSALIASSTGPCMLAPAS